MQHNSDKPSAIQSLYPAAVTLSELLNQLLNGRQELQGQLRSRLAVAEALADGSGVGWLLGKSIAAVHGDAPAVRESSSLSQQSTQSEVHLQLCSEKVVQYLNTRHSAASSWSAMSTQHHRCKTYAVY